MSSTNHIFAVPAKVPSDFAPNGSLHAHFPYFNEVEARKLISAIQQGVPVDAVRRYLASLYRSDAQSVRQGMNSTIDGFPLIFHFVCMDNVPLLRCWAKYGGNPKATYGERKLPLLVYAVIHERDRRTVQRVTSTVEALLSLGASPFCIPDNFYTPFMRNVAEPRPSSERLATLANTVYSWWTPAMHRMLDSAFNITLRYLLWQASISEAPTYRKRFVASQSRAKQLFSLPFLVVGQRYAVEAIKRRLLARLASSRNEPLVIIFAGPSGHGKTEVARRLGELISMDMIPVDCTTVRREDELFGGSPHYVGAELGSPLNNFLASHSGLPSIVFLDEFEKTTKSVHNALLILFEQGEYLDRRNWDRIDCSKTIWIAATNMFDDYILRFCEANQRELSKSIDGQVNSKLIRQLIRGLAKECLSHFGAPLAGRMAEIIPFLPFTEDEQAVIARKAIMELEEDLRQPPVISRNGQNNRLVGNVYLTIKDDVEVCSAIARDGYMPQLGARSIRRAVDEAIRMPLVEQYLEIDEDIRADQPIVHFTVGMNADNEINVWPEAPRNPLEDDEEEEL